jgi:putative membrane protein
MTEGPKRLRYLPDVRLNRVAHSGATQHRAKGIHVAQEVDAAPQLIGGDSGTELASIRTTLAFDRTALATDRTLMAMVRTSLALIGFGFTIFTFFHTLSEKYLNLPAQAPRRFGGALIVLGVILLTLGIFNHRQEVMERRRQRQALFDQKLVHHPEIVRTNATMVIAILLLLVGLVATLKIIAQVGPF